MKKSLKNILASTAIVAGSLGCLGGEVNAQEKDALTQAELLKLGGAAALQSDDKTSQKWGLFLSLLGQMKHDKEVARAGKTDVYGGGQQQGSNLPENVIYSNGKCKPAPGYAWISEEKGDFRVKQKELSRFAGSFEWEDHDKDGIVNFRELGTKKDIFTKGESMAAYLSYETRHNVKNENFSVKLFGPDKRELKNFNHRTPYEFGYAISWSLGWVQELGTYTVELYSDEDKRLLSHQFRVTENKANSSTSQEPELLCYNKWVDLNNDGKYDVGTELFGLEKRVFNLNREDMNIDLCSNDYEGEVIFRTWTSTGNLIGETIIDTEPWKIKGKWTGPEPNPSTPKDFMDKLKEAGSGDYVITANTDDGKTYRIDVKIINE